jgi:hypothetical protein
VPVRSARCRGQQTKTNSPNQDGKIKAAVPRAAKPLTWLSFLRAVGRSAVPLADKKHDFSRSFSAPAIQKYPRDPREQRPANSRSNRGRREKFRRGDSARQEAGGCRTRFDDCKEGWFRGAARSSGKAAPRSAAIVCSPPNVVSSSRPGWSAIGGGPSARRHGRPASPTSNATASPGTMRRAALRGPHRRHRLRAMRPQRPASLPLRLHAGGCRRDDRPQGLHPRPSHLVGQMESDLGVRPDWTGHRPCTDTRICISWCAALQMTVPISSSRAITSAPACARGPRTWFRPSSAPSDPRPTLAMAMRSPTVLRRVMRSPMKGAARTAMSTGFSFAPARPRSREAHGALEPAAEAPRLATATAAAAACWRGGVYKHRKPSVPVGRSQASRGGRGAERRWPPRHWACPRWARR